MLLAARPMDTVAKTDIGFHGMSNGVNEEHLEHVFNSVDRYQKLGHEGGWRGKPVRLMSTAFRSLQGTQTPELEYVHGCGVIHVSLTLVTRAAMSLAQRFPT